MSVKSVICVSLLKSIVSRLSKVASLLKPIVSKSSVLRKPAFFSHSADFFKFFFRLPFCVCFRYSFIILLEAKHTLIGLEIIFILFWSIYGHFIIRWNFNIVTKIYLFDDTIRNFCHFFSQMSFESVSSNKLSSVYMSSVFILLLKGLFSSNTSSTKSISSFCFFFVQFQHCLLY